MTLSGNEILGWMNGLALLAAPRNDLTLACLDLSFPAPEELGAVAAAASTLIAENPDDTEAIIERAVTELAEVVAQAGIGDWWMDRLIHRVEVELRWEGGWSGWHSALLRLTSPRRWTPTTTPRWASKTREAVAGLIPSPLEDQLDGASEDLAEMEGEGGGADSGAGGEGGGEGGEEPVDEGDLWDPRTKDPYLVAWEILCKRATWRAWGRLESTLTKREFADLTTWVGHLPGGPTAPPRLPPDAELLALDEP